MTQLGLPSLSTVDRLDLTAEATLDGAAQDAATRVLRNLRDPEFIAAAGLHQPRLLGKGDPAAVLYAFTLYERVGGASLLRVQTDNLDQPLDINEGVKLDLGSTAKLRTLVTYLDVVADLHERFARLPPPELRAAAVAPTDTLSHWAVAELTARPGASLRELLEAAMNRVYSANPREKFFTGGGLHTFANFDTTDDHKSMTVREAFRSSVNLVFVRMMRDIVHYYTFHAQGSSARILADERHPLREAYLRKFADQEGRHFLERFYRKYTGLSPEDAREALLRGVRVTPRRLATALRALSPDVPLDTFATEMRARLPGSDLRPATLRELYDAYDPSRYDVADRGLLVGVHPLELWLVAYLRAHPRATFAEAAAASVAERVAVYRWLMRSSRKRAQDTRIRILMEVEAFQEIHRQWRRYGYPFDTIVPSYATSIGSSADRPAALAELVGIIAGGGVRHPPERLTRLRFGEGTPYETTLVRGPARPERVMHPEVAETVRAAVIDVVENGTGRRAAHAFGPEWPVGGKTGTGDQRLKRFGPGGKLLDARVLNRTATFAFMVGDRYYGVMTAYVAGAAAAEYEFTSALPSQVFKRMACDVMPALPCAAHAEPAGAEGADPAEGGVREGEEPEGEGTPAVAPP
jgi:membrane peptidoglycan carboxypeptidase